MPFGSATCAPPRAGLRDTVRLPNFQALGRLRIGETVEEVLKADLALEGDAIPLLRDAIAHCEIVRDYIELAPA